MPSFAHQTFVLLFRAHPELTFELARRAGAPIADSYESIDPVSAEFEDPLNPKETVRADVALAGKQAGKSRRAVVFEVQLWKDPGKEWTIVLYRAGVRRQEKCPAWAIVFSPDAEVREFVGGMFEEEPELRPFVVTPEMISPIRDLDAALRNYPIAVLGATVHASDPEACTYARVAIQALLRLVPEHHERYLQLIADAVGESVMQRVREELPPEDLEFLSPWERRGSAFTRGHAEGREEGREEGRAEGLRAALRTILAVRGLPIDERTHARIEGCADPAQLQSLIEQATIVTRADELLAEPG